MSAPFDAATTNASNGNNDDAFCISLADVQAAATRLQNVAHRTPVLTSQSINALAQGRKLFFKVEALQKTGSFKFRGAYNAVSKLLQDRKKERTNSTDAGEGESIHVITHSSGNHAQALAKAAQLASTATQKVHATIVMPNTTPLVKLHAVQDFGATIVMVENDPLARERECDLLLQNDAKAVFVHPSEEPLVIAGQGTVSLELLEQVQSDTTKLDVVIIPVGGGGLAAGNVIALRGMLGDKIKIVLAEPSSMDDAKRSFDSQTLCEHDPDNLLDSVADGLKTTLGPNTFPIIRDLVDDILTVSEYDILRSTKLIWERLKVAIEPSAGVGVAVALYSDEFQSKFPAEQCPNVAIILCGGNVDIIQMALKMQDMGI
jgi:serine racemase